MIDIGSIVKFHSTGSDELEGKCGQIVGILTEVTMWIVKVWDKPKSMRGDYLVMRDTYLEEIHPMTEEEQLNALEENDNEK